MLKKSILSDIDECIESWSRKKGTNKSELAGWRSSVSRLLAEIIKSSTHKYLNIESYATAVRMTKLKDLLIASNKWQHGSCLETFFMQVLIEELRVVNKLNIISTYK